MLALALLLGLSARAGDHPGKKLFDAHGCRACHSVGGVGGNVGPDLTLAGFRRPKAWLEAWLRDPRAWKHDTLMPDPKLSEGDRGALASYLSSLKEKSGSWPSEGRALFARAGCVACHGAAGRGGHPNANVKGNAVPVLRDVAGTYTHAELVTKIRRGSRPEKADPAGPEPAAMPPWGEILTDDELGALAGYVLSLAPKTKGTEW